MMTEPKHADLLTVHTVKGPKQFTNCDYLFATKGVYVIFRQLGCRLKYHYCDLTTEAITAHSSDAIARLRSKKGAH